MLFDPDSGPANTHVYIDNDDPTDRMMRGDPMLTPP